MQAQYENIFNLFYEKSLTWFYKIATMNTYQSNKLYFKGGIMKNLLVIVAVVLSSLLVACTNDQNPEVAQNTTIDYSAVYNAAMKNIIANESSFAANMASDQVEKNNIEVFAELQSTLKASGCYNEKIEKAYFNAEAVKLGYKPAEYAAMCMIAK